MCPTVCALNIGLLGFSLRVAPCIRRLGLPLEVRKLQMQGTYISCLMLWLNLHRSEHQLRESHSFYYTRMRNTSANSAVTADFSRRIKYLIDSWMTHWLSGSFRPVLWLTPHFYRSSRRHRKKMMKFQSLSHLLPRSNILNWVQKTTKLFSLSIS